MTLNGLKEQLAALRRCPRMGRTGPSSLLLHLQSSEPRRGHREKLHPKMWWVFVTSTESRSSCAAKEQQTTGPNQSLVWCLHLGVTSSATHNHSNKLIINTILPAFGPSCNALRIKMPYKYIFRFPDTHREIITEFSIEAIFFFTFSIFFLPVFVHLITYRDMQSYLAMWGVLHYKAVFSDATLWTFH